MHLQYIYFFIIHYPESALCIVCHFFAIIVLLIRLNFAFQNFLRSIMHHTVTLQSSRLKAHPLPSSGERLIVEPFQSVGASKRKVLKRVLESRIKLPSWQGISYHEQTLTRIAESSERVLILLITTSRFAN